MNSEIEAQEYIHVNSIGNSKDALIALEKTGEILDEWYNQSKITGYRMLILTTSKDAEEKSVYLNYQLITKGNYPFLYLIVQPDGGEESDSLKIVMKDLGFKNAL